MTEAAQLRKCSKCRCNILLETYFSKNRKGEYKATCNGCLAKRKKNRTEIPKDRVKCNKTGCNYACSTNSSLKQHIKQVHDQIKDIQCLTCDFKCSTNGHLTRHIKAVHNKVKDFICLNEGCDFKFSTNGDLKQHIKAVHNQIRDFQCEQCEYTCSTNGNLTRHIKQVHLKIKDFQCPTCELKCFSNSSLKIHINRCKGEEVGSSGEVKIKKVLNEMKIGFQYDSSYEVKNEKNNLLRWDFIITDYDDPIFIEYDGKQHFEPRNFGGMSEEKANEAFQKQKEHDKIKNDYCDENGYHLLRIPYTEYANIEAIITEFMTTNTDWGSE